MSAKTHRRKGWLVEPKIQGRLLGQVVLYWIVCLIGIAALLLCWRVASCPTRPIYAHLYEMAFYDGPVLLAALLLLPLVALDTLRFSNRFFGPLSRLRRSMERLARGRARRADRVPRRRPVERVRQRVQRPPGPYAASRRCRQDRLSDPRKGRAGGRAGTPARWSGFRIVQHCSA